MGDYDNMATESKEEFIERMHKKLEEREKFISLSDWYVPEKFANFTCLGNYNHTFKSDKPALSLVCPACGAQMEMDNPEDFE